MSGANGRVAWVKVEHDATGLLSVTGNVTTENQLALLETAKFTILKNATKMEQAPAPTSDAPVTSAARTSFVGRKVDAIE